MNLVEIINEVIGEYSKNKTIKLYHRIGFTRGNNWPDIIKSVMTHGLEPYGDWEGGEIVWLSTSYDFYAEKGKFVVSLDFDLSTNGEKNNKYGIECNGAIAVAHDVIPFKDLQVVKIPLIYIKDVAYTSDAIIKDINSGGIFIPDRLNLMYKPAIIYKDLFNSYIQPFINIPDYIGKLDPSKVSLKTL